jgi:hypothetical protein
LMNDIVRSVRNRLSGGDEIDELAVITFVRLGR